MNKNLVIGIVIVFLLLLGGGYFMMKGNNVSNSKVMENKPVGTTSTLKDLLGLGMSQKCNFDGGEMFITEGRVRGNFAGNSHMIVEGDTSYIWTDDQQTGFKSTFDLNKNVDIEPATVGTSVQSDFDYSQPQNYNCASWNVDNSVFQVPSNINFQDMSTFVDPPKPVVDSDESQCSYCDALTGDSKSQCLTSLNCN